MFDLRRIFKHADALTIILISLLLFSLSSLGLYCLFKICKNRKVKVASKKQNQTKSRLECPEDHVSILNRITFTWFNGLARLGYKRALEIDDLWELPRREKSGGLLKKFEKLWDAAMNSYKAEKQRLRSYMNVEAEKERISSDRTPLILPSSSNQMNGINYDSISISHLKQPLPKPPSIIWNLFLLFKWDISSAMIFKCISDLLQFTNPQLLKLLIKFIENPKKPLRYGIFLAISMFVVSQLSSFFLNYYYYLMYRVGTRIQSVLTNAVYKKALKLSNSARREKTVGEIVNLMVIDVDRFQQTTPQTQQYWSTPLQITLALYFLWNQIGISVLSGVGVMVLLLPINFLITLKTKSYQADQMVVKDERTKMVNEVLNGIKVIKLYAWEPPMESVITKLRNKELKYIRKASFLRTINDMLNSASPFLVALSTFATFIYIDPNNVLTPEIAFVSLTLFNQLRTPMSTVADLITQTVQLTVSNKRLKQFFVAEELEDYIAKEPQKPASVGDSIDITDASLVWDHNQRPPTLQNLEISISRGDFICIVGKVGSGKSSFLSALLGEMERIGGRLGVYGQVAYFPQQAWIQNQTVRNNITFGSEFDEYFYKRVINSCALMHDMNILPHGDQTEIGEKGLNLSGGQKARISLARAVYQNRDIYLLDDPLSAVDSHVGHRLFTSVFGPNGLLRNKTRVLVTHETSCLRYANLILIMSEGRIVGEGSYAELMDKGELAHLLEEVSLEQSKPTPQKQTEDDDYISDDSDETFVDNEHTEVDSLFGTSALSTVSGILTGRRYSATNRSHLRRRHSTAQDSIGSTTDLSARQLTGVERVETGRVKPVVYIRYFEAMGSIFSLMFVFGMTTSTVFSMLRNLWLTDWSDDNVGHPPEDAKPISLRLGVYAGIGFLEVLLMFFGMLSLLFGGVSASKNLHSPLLHAIFRAPMRFFDTTPFGRILNRIGKDIETIDLLLPYNVQFFATCILQVLSTLIIIMISTPIFGFVVIPLAIAYVIILGASTIRGFNSVERFCRTCEFKVDKHVQCRYFNYIANRWLTLRLEFLGNLVVLFAALFAALTRASTSAGVLGLSVSYSLNITFVLNFAVRQISKLETNIVSVERVKEYSEAVPEASWESSPKQKPPPGWPGDGKIVFSEIYARYRPGLAFVLHGFNAEIQSHEKVAIVGRTGSGKSSVTLALFRMIEPTLGKILIDSIDITTMGLHDLRSNITIIPQDPVLFSGTLRFNLDPFNRHTDNELWSALDYANLKDFTLSLPQRLDHEITEGGDNISVGQRQLVCLARALLRKTKVLVLDEATAAVDLNTDALIQKTIRQQFKESTIITIAHRLNTVMDYDRVMVLDTGRILEFDSPANLMNRKTAFYSMVNRYAQNEIIR